MPHDTAEDKDEARRSRGAVAFKALDAARSVILFFVAIALAHQCYVVFYAGQPTTRARELYVLEENLRVGAVQLLNVFTQIALEFSVLVLTFVLLCH